MPVANRVLAALGPKMLELAATRSRGAHPYLVMPDHTHYAREVLGDGPLLLPEQTVLLTNDRDEARAIGTDWLRAYLALPNYANNLLRSGFTQDDLDSVSDRLFDAIIAWGDEEAIAARVNEHKRPGRTTFAFRCSLPTRGSSPANNGDGWPRHSPSRVWACVTS